MNPISKYIGKEVRRIVFALCKKDKTYHNLFTIIEALNDDMQDINAFEPNCGKCYCDRIKGVDGQSEKIYMAVEKVVLLESMIANPWEGITVGSDKLYPSSDGFDSPTKDALIIPMHSDDKNELKSILPHRKQAAYVQYYVPKDECSLVEHVLGDKKLLNQLQELSLRNLGYDLSIHKKFLGGYILLCYNDIYHSIDLTEDWEKPGIYCRVNYRHDHHDKLKFLIRMYAKDGNVIGEKLYPNEGKFLERFDTGHSFHSIAVDVFDEKNTLIDYYPKMCFVHTISVETSIKSKDVVIKDDKGREKVIEKFVTEKPFYIGEKPQNNTLFNSSSTYTYKQFEDSLDFVFFDGEKDSKEKARACVRRILDNARKRCYICDIYFHDGTLVDFVVGIKNQTLDVRILSSKENLKTDRRDSLRKTIKELNDNHIANITCRLLRGNSILHDRLIIADDSVWMLGCSLNEYGERATTLIRVPHAYCNKLIAKVEEWWNDNAQTEEV